MLYESFGEAGFNEGINMTYVRVEALGDGVNSLNYSAPRNKTEETDIDKDKSSETYKTSEIDLSLYSEDKVNILYEEIITKALNDQKQYLLSTGEFKSEEEANRVIEATKEAMLNISLEEKINNILDSAPERAEEMRDDEGKPACK